jgi:hypothetical protein
MLALFLLSAQSDLQGQVDAGCNLINSLSGVEELYIAAEQSQHYVDSLLAKNDVVIRQFMKLPEATQELSELKFVDMCQDTLYDLKRYTYIRKAKKSEDFAHLDRLTMLSIFAGTQSRLPWSSHFTPFKESSPGKVVLHYQPYLHHYASVDPYWYNDEGYAWPPETMQHARHEVLEGLYLVPDLDKVSSQTE